HLHEGRLANVHDGRTSQVLGPDLGAHHLPFEGRRPRLLRLCGSRSPAAPAARAVSLPRPLRRSSRACSRVSTLILRGSVSSFWPAFVAVAFRPRSATRAQSSGSARGCSLATLPRSASGGTAGRRSVQSSGMVTG